MSRADTRGVVTLPSLDLRAEPAHRAELVSQLLLGEAVRLVGRPRSGWQRVVADSDGYAGWARDWGWVATDAAGVARWRRAAKFRVHALVSVVTARPGEGLGVGPLPWGSRVIAGPRRAGFRRVEWPDGRRGWAPAADLREQAAEPPELLERAFQLLGVPYLWGGRTPAGIDCSALVQLLLAEQGIALPRDARDQHRVARSLEPGETERPGDLAFFRRPGEPVSHVGLCAGRRLYVHARGWVRIASLDPDNPFYDKDLVTQFCGWGRPGRKA